MSIDHIFFSLQQMESRIFTMEAEQKTTNQLMIVMQQQINTVAQRRNQMRTLHLAQQALHAQFQEVAASFHQVQLPLA